MHFPTEITMNVRQLLLASALCGVLWALVFRISEVEADIRWLKNKEMLNRG